MNRGFRNLMIVLSGLAAIPLDASAILDISDGCKVTQSVGTGTCTLVQQQPIGANPNLNWVQFFGSGTGTPDREVGTFVEFLADGAASGTLPAGSIPVSWDFILSSDSRDATVGWFMIFDVRFFDSQNRLTAFQLEEEGTSAANTEVKGMDSLVVPSQIELVEWTMQLTAQTEGVPFSVQVPAGSTLDFNPTPEPATVVLTGAVLAGLLIVKRKIIFEIF